MQHANEGGDVSVVIIQKIRTLTFKAYRCGAQYSEFYEYCGAYSHNKLSRPPSIGKDLEISVETCTKMIKTGRHTLPSGKVLNVGIGRKTHFNELSHGKLTWGDNVKCEGVALSVNGEQHNNMLVFTSGHVTIEEIELEYDIKSRTLTDITNELELALVCSRLTPCTHGPLAYVFFEPPNPCPLRITKTVRGKDFFEKSNRYIYAEGESIFINVRERYLAPQECKLGGAKIFNTQIPNLLILIGVPDATVGATRTLSAVTPYDVDLETDLLATASFLSHKFSKQLNEGYQTQQGNLCKIANQIDQDASVHPFKPNTIVRNRGDIITEIKCKLVKVEFPLHKNWKKCFVNAIPVLMQGEPMLVDVNTWILSPITALAETNCNNNLPPLVMTDQNVIISVHPVVRVEKFKLEDGELYGPAPMEMGEESELHNVVYKYI